MAVWLAPAAAISDQALGLSQACLKPTGDSWLSTGSGPSLLPKIILIITHFPFHPAQK